VLKQLKSAPNCLNTYILIDDGQLLLNLTGFKNGLSEAESLISKKTAFENFHQTGSFLEEKPADKREG
jgi:hypothetical protein